MLDDKGFGPKKIQKPDVGSFFAKKKAKTMRFPVIGKKEIEENEKEIKINATEIDQKAKNAPNPRLINDYFKNKLILWMLGVGIISNAFCWGLLFFLLRPIDPDIILHYNVYFGVDMVGDYKLAFIMPLIGLIIYFFNSFLALFLWAKKERIASHILLLASIMSQFCLIVASISTIIINY